MTISESIDNKFICDRKRIREEIEAVITESYRLGPDWHRYAVGAERALLWVLGHCIAVSEYMEYLKPGSELFPPFLPAPQALGRAGKKSDAPGGRLSRLAPTAVVPERASKPGHSKQPAPKRRKVNK